MVPRNPLIASKTNESSTDTEKRGCYIAGNWLDISCDGRVHCFSDSGRIPGQVSSMRDPRIPLKSPYIAGALAFLCPGAGHWYQGRRFKATIFSIGILSIFVWGMLLGNLQPVYSQVAFPSSGRSHSVQMEKGVPATHYSLGYGAQILNGGLALPAILQQVRFRADEGVVERLDEPLSSDFVGVVRSEVNSVARTVTGTLNLEPRNQGGSRQVHGTFRGKFDDGTDVELTLGGEIRLGRKVFGSPRREIVCRITDPDDPSAYTGDLTGSVQRSLVNWFQAPRDNEELDRLHGDLSRMFDLASVFTWIAGLLNLFAIWDAVEGPAYGYGDESGRKEPEGPDDSGSK